MIDSGPREEMLKALGLATEEATAKAREESAGAIAALTSEKQALQAMNEGLRREIDTLTAQIAEERRKTRVEQDRVEEATRDREITGRTADADKARLGEQIRELQERLKRTEEELAQYKKMFTDQLGTIAQLDGWGDISETQLRARIKETQRKKKPSSLECDTASLSPRGSSTPPGSLTGTPVGGFVEVPLASEGDAHSSGSATPTDRKKNGFWSKLSRKSHTLGSRPSTPKKGTDLPTSSGTQPSSDDTSRRSSGGTVTDPGLSNTAGDSTPTSLESAPEGGSGGKGPRKLSLTVDTGEQTTGGVTEEDPGA
jgi:hypothetical protein